MTDFDIAVTLYRPSGKWIEKREQVISAQTRSHAAAILARRSWFTAMLLDLDNGRLKTYRMSLKITEREETSHG